MCRSGVYDVSVTNQHGEEVAVFSGRSVVTRASILSGEQARYDTEYIENLK